MSNNTEVDQQISETVNTANPNTIMNNSPHISSQSTSNLVTSVEQIIANIKQLQTPEMQLYTNLDNQNLNQAKRTKDLAREIIYIRYDNVNMKYVYLCCTCDTVWKTEENK